ncbi:MAG: hypothetical protein GXY70_03330 [Euryarchaeota archaeon]|nr:hypothetical protein [Euryarchaeota archaeon]
MKRRPFDKFNSLLTHGAMAVAVSALVMMTLLYVPANVSAEQVTGWADPTLLSEASDSALGIIHPQVAMNDKGDAIAIWTQQDGSSQYNLHARMFSDGSWGRPVFLENSTGNVYNPRIAMNEKGDAVAVWRQSDGAFNSVYANEFVHGSWGTATLLEGRDGNAYYPQIAVDGEGNAIAVWHQSEGTYNNIYANRYSNRVWGEAMLLESNDSMASDPQIAMDDDGDAIVVWRDLWNGTLNDIHAISWNEGTWGDRVRISEPSNSATNPQIATDGHGTMVAVWYQVFKGTYRIFATINSNGTWGVPVQIDDNSSRAIDPSIAMNDRGDAVVVWRQQNELSLLRNVCANVYSDAAWGTPTTIRNSTGNIQIPSVALADNGDAIVTWSDDCDSPRSIYADRYSNGIWETPTLIEDHSVFAENPRVAMDGNGNAIMVWNEWGSTFIREYALMFMPEVEVTVDLPIPGEIVHSPSVLVSGAVDPGLSLTINDHNVANDGSGHYSAVIPLLEGANTITVIATNGVWGTSGSTSVTVTYVNQMQQDIDELDQQLDDVRNETSGLADQLNEASARLNETRALLNLTRDWLQDVSDRLASCCDAQNMTAEQVSEALAQISSIRTALLDLRDTLNNTNGNVTELNGSLDASNDDIVAMMGEIDGIIAELDSSANAISSIQDDLSDAEGDIDALKSDGPPLALGALGLSVGLMALVIVLLTRVRKPKAP